MALVYLLRHGQASFGADDYDVLSERGLRQSAALGAELARRGVLPTRVWSGTLRRQRDTAVACLAAAGVDLAVAEDERWNEYDHLALVRARMGGGAANGSPPSPREFQRLLDDALIDWLGAPGTGSPGTDPAGFGAFADGTTAALADVVGSLGSGGVALVFTSGGVIAALVTRLLGLPPEGFVAVNRVSVNAAITKIVHGRSGTSLLSFNDHGHFDADATRDLLTYR